MPINDGLWHPYMDHAPRKVEEPRKVSRPPTTINMASLLDYASSDYEGFKQFTGDLMVRHADAIRERARAESRVGGSTGRFPGELTDEQVNAIRAVEMMKADAIREQELTDSKNRALADFLKPQWMKDAEFHAPAQRAAAEREAQKPSPAASWEATKSILDAIAKADPNG